MNKGDFDVEEWESYVNGPLFDTKERDRQPLGGVRPVASAGDAVFGTDIDGQSTLPEFNLPSFGAKQQSSQLPESQAHAFEENIDEQVRKRHSSPGELDPWTEQIWD